MIKNIDRLLEINQKERQRSIRANEKENYKDIAGRKCQLCKKSESRVGTLEIAHIKRFARYKTDKGVRVLCRNCHSRYDGQKLSSFEAERLGLDYKKYLRYTDRRKRKPRQRFFLPKAKMNFGV
jgi:hypothetical protein